MICNANIMLNDREKARDASETLDANEDDELKTMCIEKRLMRYSDH